jgi:hypothetical protein
LNWHGSTRCIGWCTCVLFNECKTSVVALGHPYYLFCLQRVTITSSQQRLTYDSFSPDYSQCIPYGRMCPITTLTRSLPPILTITTDITTATATEMLTPSRQAEIHDCIGGTVVAFALSGIIALLSVAFVFIIKRRIKKIRLDNS